MAPFPSVRTILYLPMRPLSSRGELLSGTVGSGIACVPGGSSQAGGLDGKARRGVNCRDRGAGPGPGRSPKRGTGYFALPVTVDFARRFFCQQASFDSVQTGTSLPYETVFSRSAGTPRLTR